jgi:hypothetical protein
MSAQIKCADRPRESSSARQLEGTGLELTGYSLRSEVRTIRPVERRSPFAHDRSFVWCGPLPMRIGGPTAPADNACRGLVPCEINWVIRRRYAPSIEKVLHDD